MRIPYDNILQRLMFCREVFSEASIMTEQEQEDLINNYLITLKTEEGEILIKEDIRNPDKRHLPIERRLIISSALLSDAIQSIIRYLNPIIIVQRFFSPLLLICGISVNDYETGNKMIDNISKIVGAEATESDIRDLAKYLYDLPHKSRTFKIRIACGIIIFIEVVIALITTFYHI